MKYIKALIFVFVVNTSFGQCYFNVSSNATSGYHTGDTIYAGNHHICFNSYLSYFGNGYDTLYLEDQVTLSILWSDHLVVYADTGVTINYTGTGNNQLLNLFYDSTVSYFDDANLNSWAINQCNGTNYDYSNMTTTPDIACTYQSANVSIAEKTMPVGRAYPNPVTDYLTVELKEEAVFKLFSISGQILRSEKLPKGRHELSVDDLPTGLYFYSLGEGSLQKLVKL